MRKIIKTAQIDENIKLAENLGIGGARTIILKNNEFEKR